LDRPIHPSSDICGAVKDSTEAETAGIAKAAIIVGSNVSLPLGLEELQRCQGTEKVCTTQGQLNSTLITLIV